VILLIFVESLVQLEVKVRLWHWRASFAISAVGYQPVRCLAGRYPLTRPVQVLTGFINVDQLLLLIFVKMDLNPYRSNVEFSSTVL